MCVELTKKASLIGSILSLLFHSTMVNAEAVTPPRYEMVEKNGVNITTAKPTTNIPTVSIGGGMGLDHRFSSKTSMVLRRMSVWEGVDDIYEGGAKYEEHFHPMSGGHFRYKNKDYTALYFTQVFGPEGSETFEIYTSNGNFVAYDRGRTNFYYKSVRDPRNTLEKSGDYLIWTKADGTKLYYYRGAGRRVDSSAKLRKIEYPNGFMKFIHHPASSSPMSGVTTNTGYQLKYSFVKDYSRVDIDATLPAVDFYIANTAAWSDLNYKYIYAINRSYEFCTIEHKKNCDLEMVWPKATINWPGGMPRAFFAGDTSMSIESADGGIWKLGISQIRQKWQFVSNDSDDAHHNVTCKQGQRPNCVVPVLSSITMPGSVDPYITYSWGGQHDTNDWNLNINNVAKLGIMNGKNGRRYVQKTNLSQNPYETLIHVKGSSESSSSLDQEARIVTRGEYLGAIESIQSCEGDYIYDLTYENLLRRRIPVDGPTEDYEYDDRHNVTKVIFNKGQDNSTFIEASYPSTCANRKTCNKADWISDAKGNKTYYTYHPQSGQLAGVTSPADENGVKSQIRYTYDLHYANYYHDDGVKRQSKDGIWLKSSESYCAKSRFSNGVCEAGDEVITRFEYNHDNLHLTSVITTAKNALGVAEAQRICYQYDMYGNQIGERLAKANVNSCNQ